MKTSRTILILLVTTRVFSAQIRAQCTTQGQVPCAPSLGAESAICGYSFDADGMHPIWGAYTHSDGAGSKSGCLGTVAAVGSGSYCSTQWWPVVEFCVWVRTYTGFLCPNGATIPVPSPAPKSSLEMTTTPGCSCSMAPSSGG